MKYFLLLGIAVLMFSSPAMGVCSVPQPRLVCAEYFASKVVVEATLLKVKTIGDQDAFVYSLRANKLIRGQITGIFRVHEENDTGRASFGWKVGENYLLFLFYSASDKAWKLDGCGNSGLLSSSKAVFEQIDIIQTRHEDGIIHGVISPRLRSMSVSGVRVEARGTNQLYSATTNAGGEFEIRVPAGRYAVRGKKAGLAFDTAEFSYENPRDLRVDPGGCVQIALTAYLQGK